MSGSTFSIEYLADGDVTVQAYPEDDDLGMPMMDLCIPQADVHALEVELRTARLESMGKRQVVVSAADVQQYDVIESLGMTVSDVLMGDGEVVLQSRDGFEVTIPAGHEIVVVRGL